MAASDDEVFFLDQHVAHERVLFERLQAELAAGPLASQTLLFPAAARSAAPAARALLERWRLPLERLGFALDGLRRRRRACCARCPVLLKGDEPRRVIEAAVDELAGPKVGEPTRRPRARLRRVPRGDQGEHGARARGDGAPGRDLAQTATPVLLSARPAGGEPRLARRGPREELKRNW